MSSTRDFSHGLAVKTVSHVTDARSAWEALGYAA